MRRNRKWWLRHVSIPESIAYPRVEPISEEARRPFWSVMIPTYNRKEYLERTLKSVLSQDPAAEAMQIEVIDNASSDEGIETLVRSIGGGRVGWHRQPRHVGLAENWNTCLERSRGRWVHILHDDDMVLPGFYATYRRFMESHPEAVLIWCRAITIDEQDEWLGFFKGPSQTGLLEDAACRFVTKNVICASAAVASRRAYEEVGEFLPWLSFCPDWEMWMRLARIGQVGHIRHPYFLYRTHLGSTTNRFSQQRVAAQITEMVQAIEVGLRRLPPARQHSARREAYRQYSNYANNMRDVLHDRKQHLAALRHAEWVFRLHPSARNIARFLRSAFLLATQGAEPRLAPAPAPPADSQLAAMAEEKAIGALHP